MEYYKTIFIYNSNYIYAAWYDEDENEMEGFLNENKHILYFSSEKELEDHCKNKELTLRDDYVVTVNLDEVLAKSNEENLIVDCNYILNLWNLFIDVAYTTGIPFYGKDRETLSVNERLFHGTNMPILQAMRGTDRLYIPKWSKKDIKIIKKVLKDCYNLFKKSYEK